MRILSVVEVTSYVKDLVEYDPILSDIWIRGGVSNVSRSAAGHMYFCLTGDNSQLNCVLFRRSQSGILALPRNGEVVLAHGRFSIYETRGQYQLMVDNVAPEGLGILQIQFEEMKRRLEAEGLFASERKRPIPDMPATIGVVTSAQGAVWHDIQQVAARRFPIVDLVLAPSTVQGPNAPDELVRALLTLQDQEACDVIIIGRGGGAAEDLACFNDERVARAIFACRVPVVSAVGHETDTCIADLVADMRAPTPSAAAEMCVPDGTGLLGIAGLLTQQGRIGALAALRSAQESLQSTQAGLARSHPQSRLSRARQDIDALVGDGSAYLASAIVKLRERVTTDLQRAQLLNPHEVLRRGYAVVSTPTAEGSRRVTSAHSAEQQAQMTLTFADGSVAVTTQPRKKEDRQ
jgi:exodeoxyribonuclease VII large subunit